MKFEKCFGEKMSSALSPSAVSSKGTTVTYVPTEIKVSIFSWNTHAYGNNTHKVYPRIKKGKSPQGKYNGSIIDGYLLWPNLLCRLRYLRLNIAQLRIQFVHNDSNDNNNLISNRRQYVLIIFVLRFKNGKPII